MESRKLFKEILSLNRQNNYRNDNASKHGDYSNQQEKKVCGRWSVFHGIERGVDERDGGGRLLWKSGVEVRVTPIRTKIIIQTTSTQNVLGEKGRRIRELTSVVQKLFKFPDISVELYAEKVNDRGLCAIAQVESLRYKPLGGLAVCTACYGVLRFIMESGAKGCEL
ncbi:hypothetical protein Dsin_027656 [Dipteronia sinensis]|uniref:KH type-2 domain-containing protein n=1 Tax=Dipteronia sinensis TaxID=43782 RepID=A0AAE0DTP0_9ROSI|nr:hypothetical protein Dsin_027656 [Dipteronia sinensis]